MENVVVALMMLVVAGKFAIPASCAMLCYFVFDYSIFERLIVFGLYELEYQQRDLYYSASALIAAMGSASCLVQSMKPPHCRYALTLSISFLVISVSSMSCVIGVNENNLINVLIYNNMITIQFLIVCARGMDDRLNVRDNSKQGCDN